MKKKTDPRQPIQPIITDEHGTPRFKENKIVSALLDFATNKGMGMNEIAGKDFPKDDRCQFAQLIGYSLIGYSELSSYVTNADFEAAEQMYRKGQDDRDARIAVLEKQLASLRKSLRKPMADLFGVHPDGLRNNDA